MKLESSKTERVLSPAAAVFSHLLSSFHFIISRHEVYRTRFSGQTFYTLKVSELRRFSLTMKQGKSINISNLSHFFKMILNVSNFNSFSVKSKMIYVFQGKLCKKMCCFLEFTQLAQILHDRRSRQLRQISTLIILLISKGVL